MSELPICNQPECTRTDHLIGALRARISEADVRAIECLSDAAIRAGAYETALEGYALALRLRSETGFHPLRRADDEPST